MRPTVDPPPMHSRSRSIATTVREHFARHLDPAGNGGPTAVLLPAVSAIEALVEAVFWASLRREEGYLPRISLAFLPAAHAENPLRFARPIPLAPDALARLGPAVERPGVHLGVADGAQGLQVWGLAASIPPFCFVIEVAAPGLLVVKHRRAEESGKYVNVMVLEGDQAKVVDERASSLPDCPALLSSLLGFDAPASWGESVNLLVELAVSMRAHGRGGSLLVVPAASRTWQASVLQPMAYEVTPAFTQLAEALRDARQGGLRHAVDLVAGLTAMDGATVINDREELLAFGVKIGRRHGAARVEQVIVTEPIEGSAAIAAHPSELGGTRHLSAAQFVHDQHDAVALIASQDGRFTVFAWSPCENSVHAHRVEALLL